MPHDMQGNELKVGDIVSIPCKVKAIHLTEEYCNVDLETCAVMPPSDHRLNVTLNSRQVVLKVSPRAGA